MLPALKTLILKLRNQRIYDNALAIRRDILTSMFKPERIVIHDSDSAFGNVFMINDWHEKRGFLWTHMGSGTRVHAGYHYLIYNGRLWTSTEYDEKYDGTVVPCRPDVEGAHCSANGRNRDSLGICLIGPSFTAKQVSSLFRLIAELRQEYGIDIDKITGHSEEDPANKKDPRFNMEKFRALLSQVTAK